MVASVKKILLAAGGTGGHVITAQAVGEALQEANFSVVFAGSGLSSNPYFDRGKFPFADVRAAPLGFFSFIGKTVCGVWDSLSLLHRESPSLVVGFGSYHTVPLMIAAMVLRIPFILYEANAIPGRVVRLFGGRALFTACFFEEAAAKMGGKTVRAQHPLRSAFRRLPTQKEARAFFQLPAEGECLLIIGGSQGAEPLNALGPAVGAIEKKTHIIHVAGRKAPLEGLRKQYADRSGTVVVTAYEERMEYAIAASDRVIARAGASTVAELELFAKPVIYVPYPHATDNHQLYNAHAAAKRGPAVVVEEKELSAHNIVERLAALGNTAQIGCHNKSVPTLITHIIGAL